MIIVLKIRDQSFYGLSPKVIFCKKCAMSNQKPISTVEFKNIIDGKKLVLILMRMVFVIHA